MKNLWDNIKTQAELIDNELWNNDEDLTTWEIVILIVFLWIIVWIVYWFKVIIKKYRQNRKK